MNKQIIEEQTPSWDEEFKEEFDNKPIVSTKTQMNSRCVKAVQEEWQDTKPKIKQFIQTQITKAREEERERILSQLPEEAQYNSEISEYISGRNSVIKEIENLLQRQESI